jgi:hypothetical protein
MSKNKGMPKIFWLLVPLAIAKWLHLKAHKMAHKQHGKHCGKDGHHGHHKGWHGMGTIRGGIISVMGGKSLPLKGQS